MNTHSYSLDELNPEQVRAVTTSSAHTLILAGAGSGKTRVLVYRIWWLINNGINPYNILAVTFTNKAAAEMRMRLEKMLGLNLKNFWIGTFHGLAHRMLRLHWQEAKLPQNFQIIDADDQLSILRKIHKNLGLSEEKWPAKKSTAFINNCKENSKRAANVPLLYPDTKTLVKIYQEYENICTNGGLVDFAELLLRSYDLLTQNENILSSYRQRMQHILIDEFQDTNNIQYLWIKLLTGTQGNLLVVGDDDQSIYSWRGANIENMRHLIHDYPDTETFRLEQNYRSTANILGAANSVIAYNTNRMGKELWTEGKDGDQITVYAALNEIDEASYIAKIILNKIDQGNCPKDIVILYRSNAQSRVLEEQLLQVQIPYCIYGGLKFFERAEIKTALAYLRLVINTDDTTAFERIINVPARGIGETTLLTIRTYAQTQQLSLWHATKEMLGKQQFPTRAAKPIQNFLALIKAIKEQINTLPFHELIAYVIEESGIKDHYIKIKDERGQAKLENLDELINTAKRFVLMNDEENNLGLLNLFLSNAALEAGDTTQDHDDNCVQLMTLHAAKGLEFPVVFLCGMEEGLFPHQMSMISTAQIEEERRLCYVGMTRAMQKLYLIHAGTRNFYGTRTIRRPSRFLNEIPEDFLEQKKLNVEARLTMKRNNDFTSEIIDTTENQIDNNFIKGKLVWHDVFGEGSIIDRAGDGEYLRLHIKFKKVGNKWLSPVYAKLKF